MTPTRNRLLILLLPLLLLLMGARQAPLTDPAPIAVPPRLAAEQVVKDIKRALLTRGWEISGEHDGRIDATLHIRAHTAVITVEYGASQVQIRYVSSENLKFEESKKGPLIHKNYLSWIANVHKDINTNLQLSAL